MSRNTRDFGDADAQPLEVFRLLGRGVLGGQHPGPAVTDTEAADALLDHRGVEGLDDAGILDRPLEDLPIAPHIRRAQDVQGLVEGRVLGGIHPVRLQRADGDPLGSRPPAAQDASAVDLDTKAPFGLLVQVLPPAPQELTDRVLGGQGEAVRMVVTFGWAETVWRKLPTASPPAAATVVFRNVRRS